MNNNNIHYNIFHKNSPFAKTNAAALLIGVGGVLSVITDMSWLVCDMMHGFRTYHAFILIGLSISVAIIVVGFILFYRGIKIYNDKQDIKCVTTKERLKELELRISQIEAHIISKEVI